MINEKNNQYVLSEHARERLAERTTLTESQLLRLLEGKAFKRVHRKVITGFSKKDIDELSATNGLTYKEMLKYGIINPIAVYDHLVVWSTSDKIAVTLIIALNEKRVVTVLHSDDFTHHDWSDKITEKFIMSAKRKAEELDKNTIISSMASLEEYDDSNNNIFELAAFWLDDTGMPKRKIFKALKIYSIAPFVPSLVELVQHVQLHVTKGRDIRIIIRNRKDSTDIALEKYVDDII